MKRKTKTAVTVKAGDYVLMGGSRASLPGDWYLASVLWADEHHVLLHRSTLNGTDFWRQVDPIEHVRAVGTIAELGEIKRTAFAAVKDLERSVREAESALGCARDAVHHKVEELAASGLSVIPRDEIAIADRDHAERRALEAVEIEDA